MYHIVYQTINLINGKIYVGVSNGKNKYYIGSGIALKNAIDKYKRKNFKREILFECESKEEAFWIESFIVNQWFIEQSFNYNIHIGGHGGFGNINKKCKGCNKNFITKKGGAIYCSRECMLLTPCQKCEKKKRDVKSGRCLICYEKWKVKYSAKQKELRKTKICPVCNKSFIKRSNSIYCSFECRLNVPCKKCGKIDRDTKSGRCLFCVEKYKIDNKEKIKERRDEKRKKLGIKTLNILRICEICHNKFIPKSSGQKYCTVLCMMNSPCKKCGMRNKNKRGWCINCSKQWNYQNRHKNQNLPNQLSLFP